MVISKSTLFQNLSLVLFLLMMAFPNMLNSLKAVILLIMLLLALGMKHTFLNYQIRIVYCAYFLFGLYQIIIGVLLQNEKPFDWFTVTILWPLFFLIFLPLYNNNCKWISILKIIFCGHVLVVVYDLLFCFGVIFGYNIPNIYDSIMNGQTPFTFYEGISSRLNFVNLNTITFTAPVLFVLWITNFDFGIKKIYITLVIIATFLLFIISGRRSLMAVFALCPILVLFFRNYFIGANIRALKNTMLIFFAILSTALISFWIINPDFFFGYVETFTKAFDSDVEPIKFAQDKALTEAFLKSPVFGHGAGALFYEPSPGRQFWGTQFELQYHLVLARTGILGFSIWMFALIGLSYMALKCFKRTQDIILISLLYGFCFMLLANATNPVFCCFDFMLSFLLVSARLNYLLSKKKNLTFCSR